ncbi:MAG: M60 family metallopeptidase [Mediterranea sp.]|jgi:hypothetical protein|nr:M60 family metallopeptidase [Mediterranea sp.]
MKKKLHFFLLCIAISLQACGGGNDPVTPDNPIEGGDTTLDVAPTSLSFEADGGSLTATLTTGADMDLSKLSTTVSSAAQDWCSVSRNNKTLTVTVQKNYDASQRTGIITVQYNSVRKTIGVSQAAGQGSTVEYADVFDNDTYSALKAGVTQDQLMGLPDGALKDAALAMFAGTYGTEFRVNSFRPYQNPSVMKDMNKEWFGYSICDNPTGIYVNSGDIITVVMGDPKGQSITLTVQDLSGGWTTWTNGSAHQHFSLKKGVNQFSASMDGLLYVKNFVSNSETMPLILSSEADRSAAEAKTVDIHFVNGKVNGYFDATTQTLEDWTRILNAAPFREIDAIGLRSQFTWTTDHLKTYNSNAIDILNVLDRLVFLEQEFDGRVKYGKEPRNRIHVIYDFVYGTSGVYLYAYENRIAFNRGFAMAFCQGMTDDIWGPAHEMGHVNQLVPAFKWAGMTEVTNNIMSNYVQKQLYGTTRFYYDEARAAIIDAQLPHCMTGTQANASSEYNLKLVPFWQLHLYLDEALGLEYYKQLYEYYRTHDAVADLNAGSGKLQLEFVRQTCNIAQLNLVDFFTQWGFLRPTSTNVYDNGSTYTLIVTQEEIDALVAEIVAAGYPTPDKDVTTITDSNVDTFK